MTVLLTAVIGGFSPVKAWASGGISGTFFLNGDPTEKNQFFFSDDFTGMSYVGSYAFAFTYTVSGDKITITQEGFTSADTSVYEVRLIDANTIEYVINELMTNLYIRVDGAESIRRGPDEDYLDWFNRLPYDEQMRLIRDDWAVQEELRKAQEAADAAKAAAQAAKPITLNVNGVTVKTDSPPVIENGRTLAPMRAVVEALGYIVSWDSATQTVEIYDPDTHDMRISLVIGSSRVKVSTGVYRVMDERALDVPAKIINGRTMIPVRFIAETLGCTVSWDESSKTVSIVQNAG
jgi:hypothetical protein